LGSLAGLVAQAVPVIGMHLELLRYVDTGWSDGLSSYIGPIIDVAVPALSAIFSDDPALGYSSITPSTQDPLEQPLTVNLKRSEEDIKLFLKTVSDIKDTLSTEIENVAERVLARIEKLQEYHKHRRYIDFRTEITSRM